MSCYITFSSIARVLTRALISLVMFFGLGRPDNPVPNQRSINTTTKGALIEGIYDYHSSENFDAYLKELGVPWLLREAAGFAAPTITISKIHQSCSRCHKNIIHCQSCNFIKISALVTFKVHPLFRQNYYFQSMGSTE